jgi:hypothetical protein
MWNDLNARPGRRALIPVISAPESFPLSHSVPGSIFSTRPCLVELRDVADNLLFALFNPVDRVRFDLVVEPKPPLLLLLAAARVMPVEPAALELADDVRGDLQQLRSSVMPLPSQVLDVRPKRVQSRGYRLRISSGLSKSQSSPVGPIASSAAISASGAAGGSRPVTALYA